MNRTKRFEWGLLPLLPLAALLLAGCNGKGNKEASNGNPTPNLGAGSTGPSNVPATKIAFPNAKKFYWVQFPKGHPVHLLTQIAFRAECEKLGYDCEVVGTDTPDTAQSVALAEAALAKNDAAGMAVWAGDPALDSLITEAASDGVPVVVPHFPTPEGQPPGLSGVISCDPAQYGKEVAMLMGQKLGGKGTIAITQASENNTENSVSKSFTDTMHTNFPKIKVLAPDVEGLDPAQAVAKAVSIMQANPDITGAFSTTGGGPQTWAGAQKETNHKIMAIGMDYTRANLDLVKSGQIYAIVAQPLWPEAQGTADLLDKLHKGQKIPWWTKLPAPIVTKDKLGPYLAILDKVDAAAKKG